MWVKRCHLHTPSPSHHVFRWYQLTIPRKSWVVYDIVLPTWKCLSPKPADDWQGTTRYCWYWWPVLTMINQLLGGLEQSGLMGLMGYNWDIIRIYQWDIFWFNGIGYPQFQSGWWFGTCFMLPSYWKFHHPNWRTHFFQRGRLKPPTSQC